MSPPSGSNQARRGLQAMPRLLAGGAWHWIPPGFVHFTKKNRREHCALTGIEFHPNSSLTGPAPPLPSCDGASEPPSSVSDRRSRSASPLTRRLGLCPAVREHWRCPRPAVPRRYPQRGPCPCPCVPRYGLGRCPVAVPGKPWRLRHAEQPDPSHVSSCPCRSSAAVRHRRNRR